MAINVRTGRAKSLDEIQAEREAEKYLAKQNRVLENDLGYTKKEIAEYGDELRTGLEENKKLKLSVKGFRDKYHNLVTTRDRLNRVLKKDLGFSDEDILTYGDLLREGLEKNAENKMTAKQFQEKYGSAIREQELEKEASYQQRADEEAKVVESGVNTLGPGANIHIPKLGDKKLLGREFEGSLDVTSASTPKQVKERDFVAELAEKKDLLSTVEQFKGSRGQEILQLLGQVSDKDRKIYIDKLNSEIVKAMNNEFGEDSAKIDPNTGNVVVYSKVKNKWVPLSQGIIEDIANGANSLEIIGGVAGGIIGGIAGLPSGPGAFAASAGGAAAGTALGSMLDAILNGERLKERVEWADVWQNFRNSIVNASVGTTADVLTFGAGKVAAPVVRGVGRTVASKLPFRSPTPLNVEDVAENILVKKERLVINTVRGLDESAKRHNPKYNRDTPVDPDKLALWNKPILEVNEGDIKESLLENVDIYNANVLSKELYAYKNYLQDFYTEEQPSLKSIINKSVVEDLNKLTELDITTREGLLKEKEIVERVKKNAKENKSDENLVEKFLGAVENRKKLKTIVQEKEFEKQHLITADEAARELKEVYVNPYREVQKRLLVQETPLVAFNRPWFTTVFKSAEDIVKDRASVRATKVAKREADNLLKEYKKYGTEDYKTGIFGRVDATDEELTLKLLSSQGAGPAILREVGAVSQDATKEAQKRFDILNADKNIVFGSEFAKKLHEEVINYNYIINKRYQDVKEIGFKAVKKDPKLQSLNTLNIRDALETARNKDLKKGDETGQAFFDKYLNKLDVISEKYKPVEVGGIRDVLLDLEGLLEIRQVINKATSKAQNDWAAWDKLKLAKSNVDKAVKDFIFGGNMEHKVADQWLLLFRDANRAFSKKESLIKTSLFKQLSGDGGASITPDQMEGFFMNSAHDITGILEDNLTVFSKGTRTKLERALFQSFVTRHSTEVNNELYRDFVDYPALFRDVKDINFTDEKTKANVKLLESMSKLFTNDRDLARIPLERELLGMGRHGETAGGFYVNPVASLKFNLANNMYRNLKQSMHSTKQARQPHAIRMLGKAFKNVKSELDERRVLASLKNTEDKKGMAKLFKVLREEQVSLEERIDDFKYDRKPGLTPKDEDREIDNKIFLARDVLKNAPKIKPLIKKNLYEFTSDEALGPTKVRIKGELFTTFKRDGKDLERLVEGQKILPNDLFNPNVKGYDKIIKNKKGDLYITEAGIKRLKRNYKGIETPDGRVFLFETPKQQP